MYLHRIFSVLLIITFPVFAHDNLLPTITSIGEASESAIPTLVEFYITGTFSDTTTSNAIDKANSFPNDFRKLLKDQDLDGSQLSFRLPRIEIAAIRSITVKGILRLNIPSATESQEQVSKYVALCDQINILTKSIGATLKEPRLLVPNPEIIEQETLKHATENALYKADAIAQILGSKIYEVNSVNILELKWHTDSTNVKTTPGLDKLTCSAKVSLTYLHQP
jgi:uncharacterized protein YggE